MCLGWQWNFLPPFSVKSAPKAPVVHDIESYSDVSMEPGGVRRIQVSHQLLNFPALLMPWTATGFCDTDGKASGKFWMHPLTAVHESTDDAQLSDGFACLHPRTLTNDIVSLDSVAILSAPEFSATG